VIHGFLLSVFTTLLVLSTTECIEPQREGKTSGTIYFTDGNNVRFLHLKYLGHRGHGIFIDDGSPDGWGVPFDRLKSFEVVSVHWGEVYDSLGNISGFEVFSDSVKIEEKKGETYVANVPQLDEVIVDVLDNTSGKYTEKHYPFGTVNVPIESENRLLIRKIMFDR
jgi:hypothetical protein